jgi:hypothetical protein
MCSKSFRIIAIMLGRLEMDVDECINAYSSMFKRIFGKKGLPVNMRGKTKGRFDSMVLEDCIREILEQRRLSPMEPFNDEKDRTCKVLVVLDLLDHLTALTDQLIGLFVQKLPRSRAQFYYDLTNHAILLFQPQLAKQFEQHLLQQASSIQPQLVLVGGNL